MHGSEIVNFQFEVFGATPESLVVSGSISRFTMENAARSGSKYLEQYLEQAFGEATRMIIEKISEPVRELERKELERQRGILLMGSAIVRDEQRKQGDPGDHR